MQPLAAYAAVALGTQAILQLHLPQGEVAAYVMGASTILWTSGLVLVLSVIALASLRRATHHQKALQDASQEREKLKDDFRQVVENLPLGLFTYRDGHFQYTNWSWEEQTMCEPGKHKTQAFVKALHPKHRRGIPEALHAFEKRQEPFRLEYELTSEFGETIHIECCGVPMFDAQGEFQHLLAFSMDVTNRVRAQTDLQLKHAELSRNNERLEAALAEIEENLQAMVRSLVKAIEAKDPYTAGHSERVMSYSIKVGKVLGLSEADLNILKMGTLMHDIGKIGVPDDILTKPTALTEEEYEIIRAHPEAGFNMIRDVPRFSACAPIVRWHHERLNGTGYPDGLTGDQIPLLVRIATVADMYDAMTSTRAYRNPLSDAAALRELNREVEHGSVDGRVVQALESVIRRETRLGLNPQRSAA